MNITVVSYTGSIDFGVIACARTVPHVADIALGFSAAVADLFKIAHEHQSQARSDRRERGTRSAKENARRRRRAGDADRSRSEHRRGA